MRYGRTISSCRLVLTGQAAGPRCRSWRGDLTSFLTLGATGLTLPRWAAFEMAAAGALGRGRERARTGVGGVTTFSSDLNRPSSDPDPGSEPSSDKSPSSVCILFSKRERNHDTKRKLGNPRLSLPTLMPDGKTYTLA
jgi:hypothetical protein